jgi:hypothetical protein
MIVFKKYRILAASLAFSAVAVLSACGSKSDKASPAPAAELGSGQGLGDNNQGPKQGPGQTDGKETPGQTDGKETPGQTDVGQYIIEDCTKGADQSVDQSKDGKGGKGKDCGKGKGPGQHDGKGPGQGPGQNDGKGPGQNPGQGPGQNPRTVVISCSSLPGSTISTPTTCNEQQDFSEVVDMNSCWSEAEGYKFDIIDGIVYAWGGCKLNLKVVVR